MVRPKKSHWEIRIIGQKKVIVRNYRLIRLNQGGTRGVARGQLPPIIFKTRKREKEKEKRVKVKKKEGNNKKIITNDHNAVHKWVKTDEFLRG